MPRILLLKAHVKAYTRKDGVRVRAHETTRTSANPARPTGAKKGVSVALFCGGTANHNVSNVPVVINRGDADEIVTRFVAAFPGMKGMIHVIPDFASLPQEVQQDAKDQGDDTQSTKGAFDHRTNSIYVVLANHDNAADLEETVFHEALGHVGAVCCG